CNTRNSQTGRLIMNITLRRTGIAAIALSSSLGLAACGGSDSSSTTASADTTDAAAQTFGSGCTAVPKTGDGSFNGMATAPVPSAASANPVLSTLVAAVTKAGLADTLNSQKSLTVLAPTNDAF